MSRTNLIVKVLAGDPLGASERAKLTPPLLALLAIGGHLTLSHADRRRLPKRMLAQLAIGGVIELTRQERDRLGPLELALLAVGQRADLSRFELGRLPRALRACVDETLDERQTAGTASGLSVRFPRIARVMSL